MTILITCLFTVDNLCWVSKNILLCLNNLRQKYRIYILSILLNLLTLKTITSQWFKSAFFPLLKLFVALNLK